MKISLILMCFISFIQYTVAQNYTHEFGKFSNEEFELQRYAKDTSAEAVVIYNIGKSYFNQTENGFEIIFERRMKIKIFSKAGLKWAQMSIPYYEDNTNSEKISELKGNTYNLENSGVKISALDPKSTFTEKENENWHYKKFAMPDVKEGSIIELSYKINSPYLFNFRNWEFQKSIPVIYSEYTTKMIPFYEYQYILQGTNKFDDFKSSIDIGVTKQFNNMEYKDMVYFFVMKDLPAFRDESYITSAQDYIVKLNFQLSVVHRLNGTTEEIMSTWPKLSKELTDSEKFGRYLKLCKKEGQKITDSMQLASKTTNEKIKIIEHYVKSNFNWNGYSDKYASKSVKEFLKSKTGNCADINLFLAGMLNAAGIEAFPVISSTRSHGKIVLDYPFHHFFNYLLVLTKIDSASLLLDATEPLSNFTEIPTRCLNDKGLIIQKDKVEWVSLKSNAVSNIVYFNHIQLNPGNDSINQNCRLVTSGYEAINYRNKFSSSYKKLKDDLFSNNSIPGDTVHAVDLNQIEKPFEMDFNKKTPVESIEDKIIISPFYNFIYTENPLKQPARNYPVDFIYKKSNKFQVTILIPNGYKLLTKPENIRINNNLVNIIYMTDIQNNDTIKIIGVYEFKKDEYGTSEYIDLKGYFNTIVDKFNEKIVLVKV